MKAVILTPVYRYAEPEYLQSCEVSELPILRLSGTSALHEARDMLLYQALKAGYDIMLFVDSDMVFSRSDVDKVIELCSKTKNIVAGSYCTKKPPHAKVGNISANGGLRVGMGFTAIHRTALTRMQAEIAMLGIAPVVTGCYFMPMIQDGQCIAEDYSFCIRAEKAGVEVMRHPEVIVGHVGNQVFYPS